MQVKAIETINNYIIKDNIYKLITTKNDIQLLYYTEKNYYIVNDKIIKNILKIYKKLLTYLI